MAVTAGYMNPAPRADFYRHIDAANAGAGCATGRRLAARLYPSRGRALAEGRHPPLVGGVGNFFAEPDPAVTLRGPNSAWHAGKVLFERYWLGGGLERRLSMLGLTGAAKLLGIRAHL